jgi:parvulin-like peptidyl-prolyl isomerase
VLNQALFSLPVGQLSRILEDQSGFVIVRVLERKQAGARSFVDVQVEIRDRIKKEKVDREVKKYIAKLRQDTPVWTAFDDSPGANDEVRR